MKKSPFTEGDQKAVTAGLSFHRSHCETLDHILLEEHRQQDRRSHDYNSSSHDRTPINLYVGEKIVDCDGQRSCLLLAQHLAEHEVVPAEDET